MWEQVTENLIRNKESETYYLRAKIAGKIVRRSLRTKRLREAKTLRDQLLKTLREQANPGSLSRQKLTLWEALDKTLERYKTRGLKASSVGYEAQLHANLRRTLPDINMSKFKPSDMEAWWSDLDYAPQLQNNILATLRRVFALAHEYNPDVTDPTLGLQRLPIRPKQLQIPTKKEFRKIVASVRLQNKRCSTEAGNYVEFLAYSGLRKAEAAAVRWQHVGKDKILVTGGATGTKNHEMRSVPIIRPLQKLLSQMPRCGKNDPLFRMTAPRVALLNACDRLGLPHLRIHDLRHLFATACIEAGVDIPTVSRWLGHKDGGYLALKTYGHLRDDHSVKAAAKVKF